MLAALQVRQFALMEEVDLLFTQGFTVFTGETGAGKSILLDAIGLLLGSRSSPDMVRTGQDEAAVEALFTVDANERVRELLQEWGMEPSSELLLSRRIQRSGRTVCRVNGRIVTVGLLKSLGELLVGQHGQHEHQGLLQQDEQLRLLDLYAGHKSLLHTVKQQYEAFLQARAAYRAFQVDEQARVRRMDALAFQIQEIADARLEPGEEDNLRESRRRLQHAERIRTSLLGAQTALDGDGDRLSGALQKLASAADELTDALRYDDQLAPCLQLIETARVHAEEASATLGRYAGKLDLDPDLLERTESRLAQIKSLERKYGATIEDVLAHLKQANSEYQELERHEERLEELEQELRRIESLLANSCHELHESRARAADSLAASVTEVIRKLSMPRAQFQIDVSIREKSDREHRYGPSGFDQVTFLLSANRGEPVQPLSRVASGGELSRTMLALKAVLASLDELDTLIFDEIDAGVSGIAAQSVAEELQRLGRHRQVLCVTHSPQIAAAATHHFRIEKVEDASSTITRVQRLESAGRVEEIARLVGAATADETAVAHADALLRSFTERA